MKHNYFIGLGGSGGKIITELYKRLIDERGKGFESDVACIAIDTDQDELNHLSQLGVNKICLSGDGTVGDYYNSVGGDVGEWCPNTPNEGNFFASTLFGGASQCRLKSRLCLANFLKDSKNELERILEDSLMLDPTATTAEDKPPVILIASSIAGGTGSGIFIQVALYVKKFFRDRGVDAVVHGLFACPDLYKNVVTAQMLPNLYANAYAVIRELNAFNLICGPDTTAAYGGKLDLDIEISTDCEGKLFEKDSEGRYGEKPYDILYFIDKLNYLSKILGGLPEYYKAMANIAYSHLYTDISGEVWSNESNEMHAHTLAPSAIYGSAGAASMKYPHDDIVNYFAYRALKDSLDSVWNAIDDEWKNYRKEKDMVAQSSGLPAYVPEPGERANHYINTFEKRVKTTGVSKNEFSFLAPSVIRNSENASVALMKKIKSLAASEIAGDDRINKAKDEHIGDIGGAKASILSKINNSSGKDDDSNIFWAISDIDENIDDYCEKGLNFAIDQSIAFSNKILCEDCSMWKFYDKSDIGIINGLLVDDKTGDYIHPVAARYLLYKFKLAIDEKAEEIISPVDTAADDADDFYAYLMTMVVEKQRKVLRASESEEGISNKKILENRMNRWFGKKATVKEVSSYFSTLDRKLNEANDVFVDALMYFSLVKVSERLQKLITEYELFFDKLDEFATKTQGAITTSEKKHELARGNVYVCASSRIKREMYEDCGSLINTKTGSTASSISKALFEAMRIRSTGSAKKLGVDQKATGIDGLFNTVSSIVSDSIHENKEVQDKINMNVFQALLYEYSLTSPEFKDDEATYSKDDAARNRLDQFISGKFKTLVQMAAPFLSYDIADNYSGMFDVEDENGDVYYKKPPVSNFYRYLSFNPVNKDRVEELTGDSVFSFFDKMSSMLPKDTQRQTVNLNCVNSENVDPYTVLCYSTVHCLQPYQIKPFDEINGGVYFEHYSKRIAEMEALQCYSMSPHLDKRWHKHGVMPYINVKKEEERRLDLAKAFLFAITYGKIGYDIDGSDARIVFGDPNRDQDYKILIHKGKTIPYFKLNRVMNWFADQESLIESYSSQFDARIGIEIEKLSKYSENVGEYKTGITNYAAILNQFKRNILRNIEIDSAKNGKAKAAPKKKDPMNLIEFAYNVHTSEETEHDKDYGELLIETLCNIIHRYAAAPYNADAIAHKDTGNEAYRCYQDVYTHIANKFMEEYVATLSKQMKAEAKEEPKKNNFGRSTEDLDEDPITDNGAKVFDFEASEAVQKDKRFVWASALFNKYFG